MQFKHPEILYALLLLVIPIVIHLFQLRTFKKETFTNVAFLKKIKTETRKSSQLKKWLILSTRLLVLACAILVFAQPFIPNTKHYNTAQNTVIYIDNSQSMQLLGQNGNLLNDAKSQLLNTFPQDKPVSIFTNNTVFLNTTLNAIKNDLITLNYSNTQLDVQTVKLKAKQFIKTEKNTSNHFIWMSDFQQHNETLRIKKDSSITTTLVKFIPENIQNIAIDSVSITSKSSETIVLNVALSAQQNTKTTTVSLYNDNILATKAVANFMNQKANVTFTLTNSLPINGRLQLQDTGLQYDNTFYFNINKQSLINVLSISETNGTTFLNRIYTKDEFNYKNTTLSSLDYSIIPKQNLIVLNGLNSLPKPLIPALKSFKNNGGSVLIIPSSSSNLNTYNQLFRVFSNLKYVTRNSEPKLITDINYNHPILQQQFYNKVSNFQYPNVATFYTVNTKNNNILNFEDDSPFVLGDNRFYVFTAALDVKNSNFTSSPLIIPVFYNIALHSLPPPQLYYTLNTENTIVVDTTLSQDEVITLNLNGKVIIPQQQNYQTYVAFKTNNLPEAPGIYSIQSKTKPIQHISYNAQRSESRLQYHNLNAITNAEVTSSFSETVEALKTTTQVNALWKWFAIFALVFLAIELLILKFFK